MLLIRSRFLVRGEVWFDSKPESKPVDWIYHHQVPQPVPGAKCRPFFTLALDLKQTPEELLGRMNKSTAYKIRRAREKDQIQCVAASRITAEDLREFGEVYDQFASAKGLTPLDRSYLGQLAEAGVLELSRAAAPDGKVLVRHAYFRSPKRSCLLHSVSLHEALADSAARNAVSRANCYLFYCDALRQREQGSELFDFGGWYPGNTNQELLDINRFKEGFGGTVLREYDGERIRSFRGWILLRGVAWIKRAARRVARPFPTRPTPEQAGNEAADEKACESANPVPGEPAREPGEIARH